MRSRVHILMCWLLLFGAVKAGCAQESVPAMDPVVQRFLEAQQKIVELEGSRLVMHIASYKGHTAVIPEDTATSVLLKSGRAYRTSAMGVTAVQDDKCRVTIDQADKLVIVTNAEPQREAIDVFLDVEAWKYIRHTECAGGRCKLYLQGSEIDHVEYRIDKDGWLREMSMFYAAAIPESEDADAGLYRPRISISFDRPTPLDPQDEDRVSTGLYVDLDQEPPVSRLPGYALIDNRLR